jgi:hypothetical protein
MESIQMNKFEIADVPGTRTLAFLVEENESELVAGESYYSLQKLDEISKEVDGRVIKEFSVVPDFDGKQDIVLLTLTKNKAFLSTGLLDEKGLVPTEDKLALSYGSLYNDSNIEYKEFNYTPNMKRRFAIIDTITCEEVKPTLHIDEVTKEVKGICKLLPLRPYVVLEVKGAYNRGAVVATDGKRIEAMSHGKLKLPEVVKDEIVIEDAGDEMIV